MFWMQIYGSRESFWSTVSLTLSSTVQSTSSHIFSLILKNTLSHTCSFVIQDTLNHICSCMVINFCFVLLFQLTAAGEIPKSPFTFIIYSSIIAIQANRKLGCWCWWYCLCCISHCHELSGLEVPATEGLIWYSKIYCTWIL